MFLNALAILAVANYDQLSIAQVIERLRTFKAVAGRGEVRTVRYHDTSLTLYDEAYNANPLSMRMALEAFQAVPVEGENKLLILGDMLELGNDEVALHRELFPLISALDKRCVLLCGPLFQALLPMLDDASCEAFHYPDAKTLKANLLRHLRPGDHVLVKASHGIGLSSLFETPRLGIG
jgi:UDP-N-acetylmuramyl pentapeptide synthase